MMHLCCPTLEAATRPSCFHKIKSTGAFGSMLRMPPPNTGGLGANPEFVPSNPGCRLKCLSQALTAFLRHRPDTPASLGGLQIRERSRNACVGIFNQDSDVALAQAEVSIRSIPDAAMTMGRTLRKTIRAPRCDINTTSRMHRNLQLVVPIAGRRHVVCSATVPREGRRCVGNYKGSCRTVARNGQSVATIGTPMALPR